MPRATKNQTNDRCRNLAMGDSLLIGKDISITLTDISKNGSQYVLQLPPFSRFEYNDKSELPPTFEQAQKVLNLESNEPSDSVCVPISIKSDKEFTIILPQGDDVIVHSRRCKGGKKVAISLPPPYDMDLQNHKSGSTINSIIAPPSKTLVDAVKIKPAGIAFQEAAYTFEKNGNAPLKNSTVQIFNDYSNGRNSVYASICDGVGNYPKGFDRIMTASNDPLETGFIGQFGPLVLVQH